MEWSLLYHLYMYIYIPHLFIYIYVCVSIYKYIECTWIQFPMWFGKCFYIVFFKSISRRIESEWILVQCFFHLPWIEHILYVYYWNILCLCFFQFLKMLRNDQHVQTYILCTCIYNFYLYHIYTRLYQLFRKSPGYHFRIGWTASIRIPSSLP